LNQEFVRALNGPQLKEKLFQMGVDAVSSSPEEFGAFIRAEVTRMGKVIKDAGIRVQ
jgi:tripartite-type tricarboxylate transporter receptor subunit TctC